jgi:O-antigen ligase
LGLSGFAWLVPLGVSIVCVAFTSKRIRMAFLPFLPWLLYLLHKTDFSNSDAVQRIGILVAPVFIGLAASSFSFRGVVSIRQVFKVILVGSICFYGLAVLMAGGDFNPSSGWYVPEGASMTLVLVGLYYYIASEQPRTHRIMIIALIFAYLLFTQSRGALLAFSFLLVFGPGKLSYRTRILATIAISIVGIYVFRSDVFQEITFRGQGGQLSDLLSFDPEVVRTGGRLTAWPEYLDGVTNIWFGEGSAASVAFGNRLFGSGFWSHPHNEYIRVYFDYGIVGGVLFLVPYVYLMIALRKKTKLAVQLDNLRRFCIAALLAFFLQAVTGNIVMYCAWYGNFLFAIIGIYLSATPELRNRERSFVKKEAFVS